MGGKTARKALPSESFGKTPETVWLLPYFSPIRFHIGMKQLASWSAPRKYMTWYFGLSVGLARLPPRLVYHDCHGTFAQTSGVPRVSASVATAFTVSGVEDANRMSTLSCWMACFARVPARVVLDWLS